MVVNKCSLEFYEDIWTNLIQEESDFHIGFTLRIMHKMEIVRMVWYWISTGKNPNQIAIVLDQLYSRAARKENLV